MCVCVGFIVVFLFGSTTEIVVGLTLFTLILLLIVLCSFLLSGAALCGAGRLLFSVLSNISIISAVLFALTCFPFNLLRWYVSNCSRTRSVKCFALIKCFFMFLVVNINEVNKKMVEDHNTF